METTEHIPTHVPSQLSWSDVAYVINWTIQNARYLEPDDTYLIEKAVDKCHAKIMALNYSAKEAI